MELKDFLNYSMNKQEESQITTHLINVGAAISRFPGLMRKVLEFFSNEDSDIKEEYNKIKLDDNELREELTCAIIYGEKYESQLFMQIIEEYVTAEDFHSIVYQNVHEHGDGEGYALACALLDDYYTYLETGVWNGLSTKI